MPLGGCHWLSRSGSLRRPGHGLILVSPSRLRSTPNIASRVGLTPPLRYIRATCTGQRRCWSELPHPSSGFLGVVGCRVATASRCG